MEREKLFFNIFFKKKECNNEENDNKQDINDIKQECKEIQYFDDLNDIHENPKIRKFSNFIYKYKKNNKIQVNGKKVLLPGQKFSSDILNESLIQILKEQFNIDKPSIIQQIAIPNILQDRNFIGIAPTGSGKTLAYLLPVFQKRQKTLIIAPTFEISVQIFKVALKINQFFDQKLKIGHIDNLKKEIEEFDLLISTPKKFIQNEKLIKTEFQKIILDEADKYFELSFQEQLNKILEIIKPQNSIYNLFSATFPVQIQLQINEIFKNNITLIIGGRVRALQKIKQEIKYCSTEEGKMLELENMMINGEFKVPCIIFLQSKKRVKEVYNLLKKKIKYVDYLSSDISHNQRDLKISKFEKGEIWILITTQLLARGVDFPDLKLVINFDMPTSTIEYVHRIGRTGRAFRDGKSITFFTDEDKFMLRKLADLLKQSDCEVPEWVFKIHKQKKQFFKKMIKNPIKRENLDKNRKIKKDKEFHQDIRKRDYQFYRRQKEKTEEQEDQWKQAEKGDTIEINQFYK